LPATHEETPNCGSASVEPYTTLRAAAKLAVFPRGFGRHALGLAHSSLLVYFLTCLLLRTILGAL